MSSSLRIVIAALGGEGGGVLANWIAEMASREGYLSQSTSVPGVAQRTGATIYYIEIFPRAEADALGQTPVMSMFPTPGDVDIVICSEIIEAGRMMQRGFVTPDRTTLVSSTHRTYSISEKEAMGSGIVDKQAVIEVANARAKAFVGFDMLETARQHNSVINAALFGALARTGVLPFTREAFEETIRRGKIAVDNNLKTFSASYDLAKGYDAAAVAEAVTVQLPFELPEASTSKGKALLQRVAKFPANCQQTIYLGVKKLVHYQDHAYAQDYLDKLQSLQSHESGTSGELTQELARYLALWMAFEDLSRVAQLKISRARMQRFREEVQAEEGQHVAVVEFLHPRVEEFCGAMPAALGRAALSSKMLSGFLGLFARPRRVKTNGVVGYLLFYLLAKMRRFRRGTLAYQAEHENINRWLQTVAGALPQSYEAAVELARCGRLIKGYGKTRERGIRSMSAIVNCWQAGGLTEEDVAALREAALVDDSSAELGSLIQDRKQGGQVLPV